MIMAMFLCMVSDSMVLIVFWMSALQNTDSKTHQSKDPMKVLASAHESKEEKISCFLSCSEMPLYSLHTYCFLMVSLLCSEADAVVAGLKVGFHKCPKNGQTLFSGL